MKQNIEINVPEGYEAKFNEKESEDEKIRKGLIKIIQNLDGGYPFEKYGTIKRDVLAWLEKQKEQKPAEWSKEDENAYKWVYNLFEKSNDAWFEVVFKGCYPKVTRDAVLAMLKSLRPQSHWKPSEEQIEALYTATLLCSDAPYVGKLYSLLNDLKTLTK